MPGNLNCGESELARIAEVRARLAWMRAEGLWPAEPRNLLQDAFGLVLLVSLHRIVGDESYLQDARRLLEAVERAGAPRIDARAGEFERAAWVFALGRLGRLEPACRPRAAELARGIHQRSLASASGRGSADHGRNGSSLRLEDLGPFMTYVALRSLGDPSLSAEIAEARERVERSYRDLVITTDLEVGLMLWLTHFHPDEPWAHLQRGRCLRVLEHLWTDPPGCFCGTPGFPSARSPLANHAISIALQAVGAMPERVERLRGVPWDRLAGQSTAFAQVLACCADLPGDLLRAWKNG